MPYSSCSRFLADATQLQKLPGDAIACLAYVANWHFIAAGDSYAALFISKSPLQHFWSLAIEEQFYFIYPLAMVVIFRVGRGTLRATALGLGALTALSVGVSSYGWHHGWGVDRLYFGTDVRAAELLVGGLVGVWWAHEQRKGGDGTLLRVRRTLRPGCPRRDVVPLAFRANAPMASGTTAGSRRMRSSPRSSCSPPCGLTAPSARRSASGH